MSNPDAVTRLVGLTGITFTNVFNACATAASAIQQTADTIRLGKYDMGIAIGSAVKTAGMLNVDNRVMYRAGVVARALGLIDADFVMGIPLSISGKSIYFDR